MQELDWCLRMILSAICGGMIGFERERKLKDAGIRTHALIALGATLVMIISKYGFFDLLRLTHANWSVDPSRITAQVVSGIGFLGAGAIINRHNQVNGLTTAAGIWVTGAIGLAYGSGLYIMGIAGTACVLATQVLGRNIDRVTLKRDRHVLLFVKAKMTTKELAGLQNELAGHFFVEQPKCSLSDYQDDAIAFYISGQLKHTVKFDDIFNYLISQEKIYTVEKN